MRTNHNLHDFSAIHSHLKLNFTDAWTEPSLGVVHGNGLHERVEEEEEEDVTKMLE